ncbi:iron-sulfur cluster assembly accessory protein [Burkholderiales bacterium GJ-E10]|nr:iron-sulfur cluster assembly accessory protein [Burkholderiales bacterium GJ-E10]
MTITDTSASPISLSDDALAKVSDLIAEEGNPNLKLRIYVTGGGCSGFQYGFAFDEAATDDDLLIERNGVAVLVDSISLQYPAGAQIGYEDGLEGSRFVIKNPNANSTCGCGSSFSA